jgi:hypothetical protein
LFSRESVLAKPERVKNALAHGLASIDCLANQLDYLRHYGIA